LPNGAATTGGAATGGGASGDDPGGAITAAPAGGATTAGGGTNVGGAWFGQINSRSPVGSIRGSCQLAQPPIAAVQHTSASDRMQARVVDDRLISTGLPCRRSGFVQALKWRNLQAGSASARTLPVKLH
jgi:hypothetical protein